ncbi:MAG: hypothetical protein AAGH57_00465 [Pseudomonadota bacterium]
MDSFLLCLLLVTAIALGGRDQITIARLSDALAERGRAGETDDARDAKRPAPLLAVGLLSAAITAGVMAYGGAIIADLLPTRAARMLVALACAMAAFELAWPVRVKPVREPTQSGAAIALVLVWRQLGDAARFVIFAFAAWAVYPLTAWMGGALGGGAAVALGWLLGFEQLSRWPLCWIRFGLAACLIVAALFIGLNARYGVG